MLARIKEQLKQDFSEELLDRLFETYQLVYEKYYLGKYRPCCLEAGRFAEIGVRMLQEKTTGTYTPLGAPIKNFSDEIIKFSKIPKKHFHQSIRIQIPRALQIIYDIRNKRDVGHVGGDIDANYTDATLSLTSCSWVLTELLRLYYTSDINTAQKIVNSLVKVRIPLVQNFDGFLKLLNPRLSLPKKVLALLYYRGSEGATVDELHEWLKQRVRKDHMDVTLSRLEHDKAFIHKDNGKCFITDLGMKYAEENINLEV